MQRDAGAVWRRLREGYESCATTHLLCLPNCEEGDTSLWHVHTVLSCLGLQPVNKVCAFRAQRTKEWDLCGRMRLHFPWDVKG